MGGAALGLVLVGYGFGAPLVPFQFWAPEVFQGANAPVSGFISVVPKIAAFAGLPRRLLEALPHGLSGLAGAAGGPRGGGEE